MNLDEYLIYLYVFVLSIFGGTAYHIRKIKEGIIERFKFSEWAGDVFISAFIGFLTYNLCLYAKIEEALASVLIGIASHQGTRAIIVLEDIFTDYLKKKL